LKYFCSEVGANSEDDSKIKGSFKEEQLRVLLDKFIKRWVTCGKCGYPELAYQPQKKELSAVCNACGATSKLDVGHKAGKQMLNEILKNPELYKTDIIKKAGPVDDQEPKEQRRQGKKNKKGGRRVDEATALALEEAKLEE